MEKMKKKSPFFYLLVLFLTVSCVLSRTSASRNRGPRALLRPGQVAIRGVALMEDHVGRMDIEVNDYPGSGANNRHDPKSPPPP